jgi:hypothetical protein
MIGRKPSPPTNLWSAEMNNTLCRILIALMVWTPFQMAQAGMIGTEQSVSSANSADRATVLNVLSRTDVASQLQSLGIDPAQASGRVQAMSDQEIAALASRLDSLPAGANDGGAVLLIIVIVAAVWWYMYKR